MEMPLLTDQLAELQGSFTWVAKLAAFFEHPAVLAALGVACLAVSLRATRNVRHTLAGASLVAGSGALLALGGWIASPLGLILTPLVTIGIFQGIHWATARSDRLQWAWTVIPQDARIQLASGTAAATVGLLVWWGSTALAVANGPESMYPGFTPGPGDWFWALFGMLGLFAGIALLIVGGIAMLKGFRAMARAAVDTIWPQQA
ncbi:hypothetical protein ACFONC_03355 [Luteimonas soli]|uniref:Uncharacterized protein n=1 Tax=Luteimonas soli TaxID=1648966 RepID=A0ABV7XIK6_9GAMM